MPWTDTAGAVSTPIRRPRGPPPALAAADCPAVHAAMQHPSGRDHQNVILGLTGWTAMLIVQCEIRGERPEIGDIFRVPAERW